MTGPPLAGPVKIRTAIRSDEASTTIESIRLRLGFALHPGGSSRALSHPRTLPSPAGCESPYRSIRSCTRQRVGARPSEINRATMKRLCSGCGASLTRQLFAMHGIASSNLLAKFRPMFSKIARISPTGSCCYSAQRARRLLMEGLLEDAVRHHRHAPDPRVGTQPRLAITRRVGSVIL